MIQNSSWFIHNANNEKQQIDVLSKVLVILEEFERNPKKPAKYGRRF